MPAPALRIGCVSFLNAKPLIYGLETDARVALTLDVPSRLLDGLRDRRFDVALLPVIDYQRMPGLRLLSSGGIGCDGPTLTVRIFSQVPIEQIRSLACDPDSHTSVALARVILNGQYGLRPEFTGLGNASAPCDPKAARLLIGDKVVRDEPTGYPYQLDLGEAWKRWTGLPFVFAAWMAVPDVDLGDLPARLEVARRRGLEHVDEIVAMHAGPHGWPDDVAHKYLTEYLQFDVGKQQMAAITHFHQLAAESGIVPSPARPLEVYGESVIP